MYSTRDYAAFSSSQDYISLPIVLVQYSTCYWWHFYLENNNKKGFANNIMQTKMYKDKY